MVKKAVLGIVVLSVFFGETVLLQWFGGAFTNGFGGHPDEAAHFISALMVRDFLAGSAFRDPWGFAQLYYLHYPKVAIGHWPPVLYSTLGIWLLAFGTSRTAALTFFALISAAEASLIYSTGKKLLGRPAGWFAGCLFVALPLVQESSARVMTEHLVTLFMLLSALQFAKFSRTQRIADGLLFGVTAAAAILTRGSAWSLALLPGVFVLLTRQFVLLRRPGLWIAAIPVLVGCVPWYAATRGMSQGAWEGSSTGAFFLMHAIIEFPSIITLRLGIALLLPAILGLWTKVICPWRSGRVSAEWAALAGVALVTLLLHCIVPASIEPRFMVTLMPSLLLFAAAGADWLARRLLNHVAVVAPQPASLVIIAILFTFETFQIPTRIGNGGYEAAVRESMARTSASPQVYLVASDSIGEGSAVAAVALAEQRPRSVVLRGSKILVREDWLGRRTQDRFGSIGEIGYLLDRIPVNVVIVDDAMLASDRRPYHDRVRITVAEDKKTWEYISSMPVVRFGRLREDAVRVYVRRSAESPWAPMVRINLDLVRTLTHPGPPS